MPHLLGDVSLHPAADRRIELRQIADFQSAENGSGAGWVERFIKTEPRTVSQTASPAKRLREIRMPPILSRRSGPSALPILREIRFRLAEYFEDRAPLLVP
jgi:hypothetical protein